MSTPYTPSNGGNPLLSPGSGSNSFSTDSDLSRTLPRQVSTGRYRGTQTITGELIVSDPDTNNPVISISGVDQNEVFSDPITKINQIVIGKIDNNKYGMKVAPPGVNVLTATDAQLIFNSNQNIFKIVKTGTITAADVTTVADGTNTFSGGATVSVPHGLDFIPLSIAFVEVSPTQYSLMPYTETISASSPFGGIQSQFYRLTTSSTDVEVFHYVVSYSPGLGSGTASGAKIKYYLLQETAA